MINEFAFKKSMGGIWMCMEARRQKDGELERTHKKFRM